jgi:cytochrome c556
MSKLTVHQKLVALFVAALIVPAGVCSEDASEGAIAALIDERQERFEAMGEAMKVYRAYLKGADDVTPDLLVKAASVIQENASNINQYFPAGSGPESGLETDALSYIWKNQDKFERLAADLPGAAGRLTAAVASGEKTEIAGAVRDVAKNCRDCHQSFRAD